MFKIKNTGSIEGVTWQACARTGRGKTLRACNNKMRCTGLSYSFILLLAFFICFLSFSEGNR